MERLKERLRTAQEALATFVEALQIEKPTRLDVCEAQLERIN